MTETFVKKKNGVVQRGLRGGGGGGGGVDTNLKIKMSYIFTSNFLRSR